MNRRKISFHVGGPDFHPTQRQALQISGWLGNEFEVSFAEDKAFFNSMDDQDLLVIMSGFAPAPENGYLPLNSDQEKRLTKYVASGRPLLLHHGGISSYPDSEVFTRLVGINWVWGSEEASAHSPICDHTVRVVQPDHPVTAGVHDFTLFDELYYQLRIHPSVSFQTLAVADFDGQELPMVMVAEGGRTEGAGKLVFLANGHDQKAFACLAMKSLWVNSVRWLTQG